MIQGFLLFDKYCPENKWHQRAHRSKTKLIIEIDHQKSLKVDNRITFFIFQTTDIENLLSAIVFPKLFFKTQFYWIENSNIVFCEGVGSELKLVHILQTCYFDTIFTTFQLYIFQNIV